MKNNCRIQYKSDGLKETIILDVLVKTEWKEYVLENDASNNELFKNLKKLAEFVQ